MHLFNSGMDLDSSVPEKHKVSMDILDFNRVSEVYDRLREAILTGEDASAERHRTELKDLLPPFICFQKNPDVKELAKEDDEDLTDVNPFAVVGGQIEYDKLIDKFGCQRIDESIVDRFVQITGRPPHEFLRRGVFFAHRDLTEILDAYEKGEKFYLYTWIRPFSEALHLGHLIPFMFSKYLQDAFKVPLVIQLIDNCNLKDLSLKETKRFARENAKDIISCGFNISRTFIFQNSNYFRDGFYTNAIEIGKLIQRKQIGEYYDADHNFPVVQAAPCFPTLFPHIFSGQENPRCLIPCAIDHDGYFRTIRDVAPELGYHKPALIESSFFPDLQGETGKMLASDPNSAIYVTDSAKGIKNKVNRYAFSGGQDSVENHRKYGANLEVDIPVKYLGFFLEDDAKLQHIRTEYRAGRMLTGEVKKELIEVLTTLVSRHREKRAEVTEEVVDAFMAVRSFPEHVCLKL